MKNALSRTLVDPLLAGAEVIPTDTMQVPDKEPVVPTQDLVSQALAQRAELAEARIDLTNREITNKSAKNAFCQLSTPSPTTAVRALVETKIPRPCVQQR